MARESQRTDATVTDADLFHRFPNAVLDHDNIDYYRHQLQRTFALPFCTNCQRWFSPPRQSCPRCWSWAVEPRQPSGAATLYAYTILHAGPDLPGIDYDQGHVVGMVALAEDPQLRIFTSLVNVARDALANGMHLQLTWVEREGIPVPAFEPHSDAESNVNG
jgi:uncharacterized OB-fold protein